MAISQTDAIYPAPIIFGAAADALDRELIVREAYWTGCSTAGHALVLSDYDSTVTLFKGLGAANDWIPITPLFNQRIPGLKVTTMQSGQILLYL